MADSSYPFDPDVRERVTQLLYQALPALYRVRDTAPHGTEQLRQFMHILSAPLAIVRQNIQELHGDLFIDSSADWTLAYLAQMVGTSLIFPDPASNRRDVRGTVGWRRRKGTPLTLQELGSELSGQVTVTAEGWKRLLMTQDLNLLRLERVVPELRPARVAETSGGPLDAAFHTLDPRPIGPTTGRYHPRHITHWTHPTQLFPLRGGTAFDRTVPTDPIDLRYVFHPLGEALPLRARRTQPADPLPTDRVPPLHFAQAPGDWFGQEGRFSIRICGLLAGIASQETTPRVASAKAAAPDLVREALELSVLELSTRRLTGPVEIAVCAVERAALDAQPPDWTLANTQARGGVTVDAGGATTLAPELAAVSDPVAMVRLRPAAPATAAFFPGATLEVAGTWPGALRATAESELAVEGFLQGALLVTLPATWIEGETWYYLAADGSLYDAQSSVGSPVDVSLAGSSTLPWPARIPGPGAAWPPLAASAADDRLTRLPAAPGCGPALLHGGQALDAGGSAPVLYDDELSLAFAARYVDAGVVKYVPFQRLIWTASDPVGTSSWVALDPAGHSLGSAQARFAELATLRESTTAALELVVRLEAALPDLVLPPSELAWMTDDGQTVLIHLPELQTVAGNPASGWATPAPAASSAVSVGVDGSTRLDGSGQTLRFSLGDVAPIRTWRTLQRRNVCQRSLCQWDRESMGPPPVLHTPTRTGDLDIDPAHGLFSLALVEPPQRWTPYAGSSVVPASVTVDFEVGYSGPIGALPLAKEPLLNVLQPTPTRLVTGQGALHSGAPAAFHALPRYATLTEALAAIQADAAAAVLAGQTPVSLEVVQIEDSATYVEDPVWPDGPEQLVIQSAELQRPVLRLIGWSMDPGLEYQSLTLRGLAFGGIPLVLPGTQQALLQFCTVTDDSSVLSFVASASSGDAAEPEVRLERCVLAGVQLTGVGTLSVTDCVVDSASDAIDVMEGRLEIQRSTVFGPVKTFVLAASESIFVDPIEVQDRFQGCIRYSRVEVPSVLPRKHRVQEGVPVRFVSRHRQDPAHARLAGDCDRTIVQGAADGSEQGAFHEVRLAQRLAALVRRLLEYTPAGLQTGVLRQD